MRFFQSLRHVIFHVEHSFLTFFGKLLCRNSVVFYLGVSSDFLLIWISDLMNFVVSEANFPICTFLMWIANYIITIIQFFRHFSSFYKNIFYYLLIILYIIPQSSILFFFFSMIPIWITPCLLKLLEGTSKKS